MVLKEKASENRVQQFLYEVSKLSFEDLDLPTFLQNIHERISELMSANNFYTAIYHKEKDMYSFPYYADQFDEVDPNEFEKLEESLTDYIRKTGRAEIITADREREIFDNKFEVVGQYSQVWIGAPIWNPETHEVMGVIALQDYENEDVYDETDVKILEIIAGNIGLFIERINNLERLKNVNTAKDKFFSIIAHDLRNPFQHLLSSSEFLLEELNDGRLEDAKELAKIINDSANKSYKLLKDLLKWSRSQMDSLYHNPKRFNISDLLKETISQFEIHYRQKEIDVGLKAPDETFVYADEEMVKFVVRNLLSNAIKFTRHKGNVVVSAELENDRTNISISDNGVGMDNDQLNALFDITEKKSTLGTQQEKGTGLGLVICKEFVEKNNGTLSVESTKGKGTTFRVSLPVSG